MRSSEKVDLIMKALNLAQGQIRNAKEDANNPFFKSKYADLTSVWHACKEALISNGLSIMQPLEYKDGSQFLCTILAHSSGQWIESSMIMNLGNLDPQKIGSMITYYRRYMLQSMVGICTGDDDDAEGAMQPHRQNTSPSQAEAAKKTEPKPVAKLTADQARQLESLIAPGDDDYKKKILDSYTVKSFAELPSLTAKGNSNFDFLKERIDAHNRELAHKEMTNA